MTKTTSLSSGIGFPGLLTIVFITLKLTNFINWSWWWILAPLWIPISITLGILLLVFITFVISELIK